MLPPHPQTTTTSSVQKNGLPFVRVFYSLRSPVSSLDWSSDGAYLGAVLVPIQTQKHGVSEGGIRIFDVTASDPKSRYKSEGIQSVLFHPTQNLICSQTEDSILTKEYSSGKSKRVKAPTGSFSILTFSPDGESLLLSVELKDGFRLQHVSRRSGNVLNDHKLDSLILCAKFCQPNRLICGNAAGEIEIYAFPGLTLLHHFPAHSGPVTSLDIYLPGFAKKEIRTAGKTKGSSSSTADEHTSSSTSPSSSSSSSSQTPPCPRALLVTGGDDSCVLIWDLATLTILFTISRLDTRVLSVSLSYDGNLVAYCCAEENSLQIAHTVTGKSLISIPIDATLSGVKWHPSKYELAFCGGMADGNVGKLATITFDEVAL